MKKNEWVWWIIGAGALLWFVNQPSVSAILNPLPYGETDPTLPKGPTVYANPISSVQAGGRAVWVYSNAVKSSGFGGRSLKEMKRILLLVILASTAVIGWSQATGTVTVNTTITAVAGTGATAVTCVITPVAPAPFTQAQSVCSVNGVTFFNATITPLPGGTNGITFQGTANSNSVTAIFTQAAATNPISWSVAANGVTKTGTF